MHPLSLDVQNGKFLIVFKTEQCTYRVVHLVKDKLLLTLK